MHVPTIICLCVCVPLSEAVDLSSTHRCPVTRVLPPSRPPQSTSTPAVVPRSSLAPMVQPKLEPHPVPSVHAEHLVMSPDHRSIPTVAILPSVHSQAQPTIPQLITLAVLPHSAGTIRPQLSRQLDKLGQKVGTASQAEGGQKKDMPADRLHTGAKTQMMVPVVVRDRAVDETALTKPTDSDTTPQPSDLSIKPTVVEHKLSGNMKTEEMLVVGDLSAEKSKHQMLQADNLSVDMKTNPDSVGDDLSMDKNKQTQNVSEKLAEAGVNSLPSEELCQQNSLSADMKTDQMSLTHDMSTESSLKTAAAPPSECVSTTGDKTINKTDNSDGVPGE